MKTFCFTVDDNIRFLKEITENRYKSIFEHPYLAMYKRLHEKYGLKVQLNMFYCTSGFDLSLMSDSYYSEWEENSDWLKLYFHSEYENLRPYEFSGYNGATLIDGEWHMLTYVQVSGNAKLLVCQHGRGALVPADGM